LDVGLGPPLARITYTGGYVLPGSTPSAGQTALPSDLEQAAVEQVAYWFQTREALGLTRLWPHGGTYEQFSGLDLLPSVASVLRTYARWTICLIKQTSQKAGDRASRLEN